ncbi:MAG: Cell division protein FtsX [Deltaproteobacteria bacterium]|nr:Cell division protein FtsX [Deltaproteobacteria bacterium]
MKLSLLGFVLRRVGNSLHQLLWSHVLTTVTMAVALFVFGAFLLLQINLQQLLKGWGEQIQITAYLIKELSAADAENLRQRLGSLPDVAAIRYTSPAQAWRDFQSALGTQSGLLEGLPRDLLPASFEITLKPTYRDEPVVEDFTERLRKENAIASVEYPKEWVQRLSLIVLAVQWAKWIFGGLMFLATFIIVGSTVKLALVARRDEFEIMQLVGASEELIQAPFVIEGMIQGLTGAVLSVAALWGAFVLVQGEMPTLAAFLAPRSAPQFLDEWNILLVLAIGLLLGAAGSLFSLRRFIQTWKASASAS